MNNTETGYKSMLCGFRTVDLQTLLGMFGQNRNGRKNELRDHAIELLRNRQQTGFNHQAYRSKILELYQSQNRAPNDGIHNVMQNQQRQMISMQPQQQRMYLTHPYPQQQMHLTQPGIPQVMVQRTRGMYRNGMVANNSHMQQYSYQLTLSRNGAQVSTNQQFNFMASAPMPNVMNVSGSNNVYLQQATLQPLPPLPSIANIKLRELPFNDVLEVLIPPIILNPQDRCMQPNFPKDLKEATFKFILTSKQSTSISMNRDMSNGRHIYDIDAQLRICHLDTGLHEIVDCLPIGLAIKINNRHIPLPPAFAKPGTKPGVEPRRVPRPINIGHYIKLNPNMENLITIFWNPDGKLYVMSLNMVKKLSSNSLINKLLEKGGRSSEETKNYIIKKLTNDDPDLATTSYRVSLICPLGKMRMKWPAKSINCDHELQCFDASIFILMNEKKPTWTCPTCSKNCLYEDIQIQSYFVEIISNPNLPDSCKEIEVLADGTWKVFEENKNNRNGRRTSLNNKEKQIDSVDLDDSDDDIPVNPKKKSQPQCSKVTKNVASKPSLVDLTLSDDEEPAKSKQENEAQAANAALILTAVDRKPQVQPQQAVTSSEQGDVIEIGSPTPPSSPAPTPPLPWGIL
ncbi:Hypothetical protein CINCED_3A012020 [Cinara cedri]|nr:Hypothetical protein CINCED_3A012020 [Cinara cedri]